MKLIITRHGETEENKNRIIQGHLPGILSEVGIEQAKKVADRLKDEKIDHIFSSDLARAFDTAKEISKFHEGLEPIPTVELRERDFGDLQGKHPPMKWKEMKWESDFEGQYKLEKVADMHERAKTALKRTLEEHKGKTVLFVAHGSLNKTLIAHLLGKSHKEMNEVEDLKNTSITIFEFDDEDNPSLKLFNCIEHLED